MATLSLSSTATTITARITGLQQIQTYDREFDFELMDTSSIIDSGTRTISAGSTYTSVSYTFSGLDPGTMYSVNVSAYNVTVSPPYFLDSWAGSIGTSPLPISGNIYIYTGSGGWKQAEAYVYTGSGGWKKGSVYIYDGSNWRN